MHRRTRTWMLIAGIGLLGLQATAGAQPGTSPPSPSVAKVTLEATARSAGGALEWEIDLTRVDVTGEERDLVSKAIDGLQRQKLVWKAKILRGRLSTKIQAAMRRAGKPFEKLEFRLPPPPTREGQQETILVDILGKDPSPIELESLGVIVTTAAYVADPVNPTDLPCRHEVDGSTVCLGLPEDENVQPLIDDLLAVAATALEIARGEGLEVGKRLPNREVAAGTAAANEIRKRLQRVRPSTVKIKYEVAEDPTRQVISIHGLAPVREVRLEVIDFLIDADDLCDEVAKHAAAYGESYRGTLEKELRTDYGDLLRLDRPIFDPDVLNRRIAEVEDRLRKDRRPNGDPRIETEIRTVVEEDVLIYRVLPWIKTVSSLCLSLGVRYSVEDGLVGALSFDSRNSLSGNSLLNVDVERGEDLEKAALRFRWPKKLEEDRFDFQVYSRLYLTRDRRQLLGDTSADTGSDPEPDPPPSAETPTAPTEVEEEEEGVELGVRLIWPLKPLNERLRHHGDARVELGARTVELEETELQSLDITSIVVDTQQYLDVAFAAPGNRATEKRSSGRLRLTVDARYEQAFELFGAEENFEKLELTLISTVFFGGSAGDLLLVRYLRGVARSSGELPLSEQFRLGGTNNVRGLEEGELIGANLGWDTAEIGLRLGGLFGKSDGNFLDTTYLKGFFDRGRLSDASSFGDLLDLDDGVDGYGLGIELRDILGKRPGSLELAWARSSDSVVNDSGTFLVNLKLHY